MLHIETFIIGPLQVCCYLVYDLESHEGLIVDPGDRAPQILSRIEELDLKIKYILGTHGHPDHILGADYFREKLKCPFLLHKDDDKFFQNPENFLTFKLWGFPPNPKADYYFKDGDLLHLGQNSIEVLHTPGHSPGSVCFYNAQDRFLLTGDTLFVEGIGRTDLPGGDYALLMESLKKRILSLPEETIIYPGHDYGPRSISTLKEEKIRNPFLQGF